MTENVQLARGYGFLSSMSGPNWSTVDEAPQILMVGHGTDDVYRELFALPLMQEMIQAMPSLGDRHEFQFDRDK